MCQRRDLLVPKDRDAVFINSISVCLLGSLVSSLRVLKSVPQSLLPRFMILLLVGLRSTTVSVGGAIVQFSSALVVFVM